jgi:hypothetical protein
MMRIYAKVLAVSLLFGSSVALADLEPWKDYEESESVWSVTTIRVAPNMDDAYLEGLKQTWVSTNEIAKKLGQIKDYAIYRSDLPQSGDFNLVLMIEFANTSDLAPNKARYEAFMKELGKEQSDKITDFSQKNYPAMREITGQYQLRKITLK